MYSDHTEFGKSNFEVKYCNEVLKLSNWSVRWIGQLDEFGQLDGQLDDYKHFKEEEEKMKKSLN